MALFDKNPNYNPNDPTSNRYLPINNGSPAKLNTPSKYSAGGLSLLKLANPLFSKPFVSSNDPLAAAKNNLSNGGTLNVPQGTTINNPNPSPLAPALSALSKGATLPGITPTPEPTPSPTPAAPEMNQAPFPATTPAPVSTGKSFYREGNSIFDAATGQKVLNPEAFKAGGYTNEVAKPAVISGGATELTTAPENGPSDAELQNIFKLAGEAGMSAAEVGTLVDNYSNLSKEERQKINDNLGITDVAASAFKVPDQTTVDYFNKGYAASQAPVIKEKVSKLDDVIAKRREDLAKATEDLQNNPWLSQASRTGRLGILNTKANADINNLLTQRQQLIDQYDKEITAIENDVTRYSGQLETDRNINAAKLNYLLNEAEKQATAATASKKTSNLKFLPDYLSGVANKNNAKTAYELEKARLENLKLKQDTGATGESKNADNSYTNLSQGIVGGYDISSYATDPNHEANVQGILTGIGKFNSVADIDNYIKKNSPQSPITGQMIVNAAGKYGVSWEMMAAIMKQDSNFADPRINDQGKISPVGARQRAYRTMNPGNVGNNDSGDNVNQGSWQGGVDAVASWLSNHKSTQTGATGAGYTNDQLAIAQSIMSPGSTLTVDKIKQADRPGVEAALTALRQQAIASGDIYGVMKASAGGAKMDTTTVQNIAKFGTAVTQIVDLKKEIDALKAKGGTGAFKGQITDKKFWNADNATIKAKLQGAIPTIARGVFGEVGVLTDNDIENYKKTIPNVKTPTEAVDRIYQGLLSTIDSKILSTYEAYANAGYDVSGFADTYRNLKQSIAAQSIAGIKVKNPITGEIRSGAGLTAADIADAKKQGYEIIE